MEVCANFLWKTKSTTGKIVGNKLKFDEGGLTASYFLNLEIDFHLSGKKKLLIFIDLLVWTQNCCILH